MKTSYLKLWQMNIIVSLLLVSVYNYSFWHDIFRIIHPSTISTYAFVFSIFMLVTLIINLLLNLFCTKYSYKAIYIIIFLGSSACLYFTNEYNILVDSDMIQNLVETDASEAFDFINGKMFLYLFFMGLLPIGAMLKTPLKFK